ncbi:MAG TPA: RNA 2',3'-cyclic phosphodiesterase [Solirubrobacterales bacterium]|nr:RNA 2',3'-cyclic phosphodiesterase [Solirubrobacterales bacterium]
MAKERPKSPRVRLFVALDLPEPVRERLGEWGSGTLGDPALRPVPAENLHLTLAFLGLQPEQEIEQIGASIEECVAPAPLVELQDPVPRPPRGRARFFALPVVSPGAEQMQAQVSEALATGGFYEPEKRPFWPHLTVARVRPEGRGSRRPQQVEKLPERLPEALREPFYGVRMTFYRSELKPSGARYVPLAQFELPGGGRQ